MGSTLVWPIFTPTTVSYTTSGASGTETAPAGATQVRIGVWGGGAGGFDGDSLTGGDGGTSGAYVESVYSITSGQTLNYSVGAGGAANQLGGLSNVTSGSKTITSLVADGEVGSGGNVSNTPGNSGGLASGATGGTGGVAITGFNSASYGGGGGGGNRIGNGNPGSSGAVVFYYT